MRADCPRLVQILQAGDSRHRLLSGVSKGNDADGLI